MLIFLVSMSLGQTPEMRIERTRATARIVGPIAAGGVDRGACVIISPGAGGHVVLSARERYGCPERAVGVRRQIAVVDAEWRWPRRERAAVRAHH